MKYKEIYQKLEEILNERNIPFVKKKKKLKGIFRLLYTGCTVFEIQNTGIEIQIFEIRHVDYMFCIGGTGKKEALNNLLILIAEGLEDVESRYKSES